MFIDGFILDHIQSIGDISIGGCIPCSWLQVAGWDEGAQKIEEPPEEFWRTLLANRGTEGQYPQPFYSIACREAFRRGKPGAAFNTNTLTRESSIMTKFVQRINAVIYNRRLIRTQHDRSHGLSRLGLAPGRCREGDLICILYGCTVPIVLREVSKSKDQIQQEVRDEKRAIREEAVTVIQRRWRMIQLRKTSRLKRNEQFVVNSGWRTYLASSSRLKSKVTIIPGNFSSKYQLFVSQIVLTAVVFVLSENSVRRSLILLGAAISVLVFVLVVRKLGPSLWALITINDTSPRAESIHRSRSNREEQCVRRTHYELIGECYVHGMMDGEAMDWLRREDTNIIKTQSFEIR